MGLIFEFVNILTNIESTMQQICHDGQPFRYGDFLTQLRARVLKEKAYMELIDISGGDEERLDHALKALAASQGSQSGGVYFESFHQALRENQRLETLVKMPGCLVLAVKFFSKSLIFISLSNGLILLYDTTNHRIPKIFANKGAIIDCLKVLGPTYLITAGIDTKIRLWNIKTEKLFAKFEIHKYATQQMIISNSTLYSYGGHDMKLVKFDISTKETDCWINLKSHITALKLVKYRSKANLPSSESTSKQDKGREETTQSQAFNETRIAAAFHDFDVVLYDLDLN